MAKSYITENKDFMVNWNWEKNNNLGIYPDKITLGSDKKVWWKCSSCGFEWETEPYHIKSGRGCPNCAREKRLKSFNKTIIGKRGNLFLDNPRLCKEWNFDKNVSISPKDFSPRSSVAVWWKCSKCGYEWKASISNRNSKKCPTGCPCCSLPYQTSVAEKIVFYYVKKYFSDCIENKKILKDGSLDLDIYIPSLKAGIEYDGAAWHSDTERDLRKDQICKSNGIFLVRMREIGCPEMQSSSEKILIPKIRTNYRQLHEPICKLFEILKREFSLSFETYVDIEEDIYDIYESLKFAQVKKSIINATFFSEWDFSKNKIDPSLISLNSNKVFWWKCKKGHVWKSSVNNRMSGNGCPICSNRKLLTGYNDLATTNPELLKEWNYSKNKESPQNVFAKSNRKMWWVCKNGHEWQATVNSRVLQKTKCPYCTNRKVKVGFNDLATTNPEILKEWNYEKNGNLKPQDVVAGSNKKVWWKCSKCGYEWLVSPNERTYGGRGCVKCSYKRREYNATPKKGESFGDICPQLLIFWDYSNNIKSPYDFCPQSNKKVWWVCEKGHRYERTIANQLKSSKCPVCNPRLRKVICVETGEIFDSMLSASKAYGGIRANQVFICCKNPSKTFGGVHWKYYDK